MREEFDINVSIIYKRRNFYIFRHTGYANDFLRLQTFKINHFGLLLKQDKLWSKKELTLKPLDHFE